MPDMTVDQRKSIYRYRECSFDLRQVSPTQNSRWQHCTTEMQPTG